LRDAPGALGAPLAERLIHPEDLAPARERLRRFREAAAGEVLELEYRARHAHGGYRWLNDRAVVFERTPDGRVRQILGLAHDVTERRNTEEELARQAAELQRSNQELEQFAYVASHDLQEPLRMVSIYCQMLLKKYGGKLGDEANEFIGFAVDGAQRMQMLLQGLLAYSRISRADIGEPSAVDCEVALAAVLAALAASIEEGGATVTHEPLPMVRAHEVHVVQLLQNLIANAIKYRGEEPPQIHVSAQRRGRSWRFAVRDNGIGIEPEDAEQVFGMFRRLHGDRYPGTGIGLAICSRITERYGGRIWVDPTPGGGSTFHFTLPAAEEP
jgi:PAS domain S-box-containing protein